LKPLSLNIIIGIYLLLQFSKSASLNVPQNEVNSRSVTLVT